MDEFHLMINQIIQDLERGKKSVHQMRDLLNERRGSSNGCSDDHHDEVYYKALDGHSMVALTALESSLSMLHNNSDNFSNELGKNSKAQHSVQQTLKKDRRGCYKRRRGVESRIMDTTNLTDDGFAWRKYGQKVILHSKHPRNYYRCTHKTVQGCQATKQVQQISENPTKHRVIYHGNHTCKLNLHKTLNIFLSSPENPDSSVYLSFGTNNTPNFSFSNTSSDTVKQEHGPIKEETQSEPSILHHHHQNISSSPSSPDPTATMTPRSEISSVTMDQVYSSSVASPHRMDMEEDYYTHMMADSIDLDFLQNLLNCDP